MPLEIPGAAAFARARDVRAKFADQLFHPFAVAGEDRIARIDVRIEDGHHQPQQSVLNPQLGQRQTACMRYISAPQRSQRTFSDSAAARAVFVGVTGRSGGGGALGSGIDGDYPLCRNVRQTSAFPAQRRPDQPFGRQ